MVATTSANADPFPPPAEWLAARRDSQILLTGKDVEAIVEAGIVPEDAMTELLHGVLLHTDRSAVGEDSSSVGDDHTKVVELLSDLRGSINNPQRHMRAQQPLICSETHEPEPDVMILRGTMRSYSGKPTPPTPSVSSRSPTAAMSATLVKSFMASPRRRAPVHHPESP